MKYTPICCLCLFLLLGKTAVAQKPKKLENVELSAEATQLLEDIKTATQAYQKKIQSGSITFGLTLTGPTQMHLIHTEAPPYEEKGQWDITYQFDAEHENYDVKARYKMELNGRSLQNWKETHHQYLKKGKTVHVWEKIGTEWKKQSTRSSPRLEIHFNPMFWINVYSNFRDFTPLAVEKVEQKVETVYALTLHRTVSNGTRTIEMSRDPQRDFLPTRILVTQESVTQGFISTPFKKTQTHPIESTNLTEYTYQLTQYEPDIWFPQIMRMERRVLNKDQQPKPPSYILTLQVEDAIFNNQIEQKYIPIPKEK